VKPLRIGDRSIGPGQPCFLIAEAGVNHNGSLDLALALVDAAAAAGAQAVKFQTFRAERLATPGAPLAAYQRRASRVGESQQDLLRHLELSEEAHRALMARCQQRGILFLSSPFDEESADFLEQLGVAAFKIPSGEINNLAFLAHVAGKGKPLIVSTGMSYLGEVEDAVRTIRSNSDRGFVLLHCVSNYPAAAEDVNLRAMQTMASAFGAPVGYSDHTLGVEIPLAAVALGACVVEKHFTLDRSLPGPDHQASADPQELASLVRGIRLVEAALGHGRKEPTPREAETAATVRKSFTAARDIPHGSILTNEMIVLKRPGTGLPPASRSYLIGRRAKVDISAGTLLSLEMLS